MVAGAIILLSRVQTVSPENWKQWTRYLGIFFILFRAAVGITDCVLVKISKTDYNVCVYVDETVWGSLYTFLDTTIDLYTTLMISTILITHIRRIHSIHAPANSSIYFAVLFHNVGRTFLLTIANLISAIFILSQINTDLIICLWTTTNFLFILLVGFDTDITRSIRVLQKKYTEISNKLGSDEGKPSLFSRAKNYIPGGSNELQPVPPAHVPTRYPNNIIELDTAVSQRHNPQSTDDSYNSNRNNYHNTPSHSLHS
ncbi:hypothetical protein CLU79DRAFT_700332 [Phycomyces nitens]|nr:hypothetical protein CLU79DRAFT_700332 [Phycomyces nitens]